MYVKLFTVAVKFSVLFLTETINRSLFFKLYFLLF